MGKRIPKKGTPAYTRYWADRFFLREFEKVCKGLKNSAENAPYLSERNKHYAKAYENMCAAIDEFSNGHSLPYGDDQ
jgi:hypothetical protein